MANDSLNDSRLTLNLSLNQYDTLVESVAKAGALVCVLLAIPDLELISHSTLHDFLWALSDILDRIEVACDSLEAIAA